MKIMTPKVQFMQLYFIDDQSVLARHGGSINNAVGHKLLNF
jgi:hypothetical protein